MQASGPQISPLERWLDTPLGQSLLTDEQRYIDAALEGVFGEHLLQIGRWGPGGGLIGAARTQHAATVFQSGEGGAVSADFSRLPFADGSVDAVLLPHTLDLARHPHDVLREAHRILRSAGHLLIVGFKPFGLWGARRLFTVGRFPPAVRQVLGDRHLRDWLQLLDLRVQHQQRFFFRLPVNSWAGHGPGRWDDWSQRWWPELGACYLLTARKRVMTMTPIRPGWKQRARVVSGLAEPSMRDATPHRFR